MSTLAQRAKVGTRPELVEASARAICATAAELDWSSLDPRWRPGLRLWLLDGIQPGQFLLACLRNDLIGAMRHAGTGAWESIPELMGWIYSEVPSLCWGSGETVAAWARAKESIKRG